MARSVFATQKEKDAFSDLTAKKKNASRSARAGANETAEESEGDFDQDYAVFETAIDILDTIPADDSVDVTSASGADGLRTDLIGQAESMLNFTGRESKKKPILNVINATKRVTELKGESVDVEVGIPVLLDGYEKLEKNCDDYINSRNPWTASGKQRMSIVKTVRYQTKWESNLLNQARSSEDPSEYSNYTDFMLGSRLTTLGNNLMNPQNFLRLQASPAELREQNDYVEAMSKKYGISREDAEYFTDNRRNIDQMDKYLGGEGLSDELIQKLVDQLPEKKKNAKRYNKGNNPEKSKSYNDAIAYITDTLGIKLSELDTVNVQQFAYAFLEDGNSEEVKGRNANKVLSLMGKNESGSKQAWESLLNDFLSVDLTFFDDRSIPHILEHYEEFKSKIYVGFVYERHILPGLRNAGFDISDEQQADMLALYKFYIEISQYLAWIEGLYSAGYLMYTDQEKLDELLETVEGRTEDKGQGTDERFIEDLMIQQNTLKSGKYQELAFSYQKGLVNTFNSDKRAIDILRKEFGWKSEKDPKDMKIILKNLAK